MLLMAEKGTKCGICQAIYRYAKVNKIYMKNYDKNIESLYLMYLDANNLYWWATSQKLPVDGFKWIKKLFEFNEDFIQNYDENSNKRYFLEVVVEYPKNLHNLLSDFPFLPERLKIEKRNNLVCNAYDKKNYVALIKTLKQALNHGLILQKVHKVIQFNQKAGLKSYIHMNAKSRTEAKNDFEKDFFKQMSNAVFGKTTENVRNHRDIKLVNKWISLSILTSQY